MTSSRTSRTSRTSRAVGTVLAAAAVAGPVVLLAPQAQAASFTKIQGAAGNAAGLQPSVDAFRALLGGVDNGNNPSAPTGRREINWDAVPDAISSPANMPNNLFNTTVPRGAVFSSPSNRFQVSASTTGPVAPRFGNVNPQYASVLSAFSQEKLFAPRGGVQTRVRFFVPGTSDRAYVSGFGAVFTDVDKARTTTIELYDRWGARLWKGNVPKGTRADGSLSFLGVKSGSARIAEVRITTGNRPLSAANADGGASDVVAIDDLVYGEPKPW